MSRKTQKTSREFSSEKRCLSGFLSAEIQKREMRGLSGFPNRPALRSTSLPKGHIKTFLCWPWILIGKSEVYLTEFPVGKSL